ncbi:protein disulfide oxidoreductase [Thalassotalea sp. PLHSN55]|uniref:protein disulfide oxidoreductase n=1 Tax=Thalassotalea sp. PLHSN55 TaxID=3435888 RepID=UPI003F8483AA
MIKNFLKQLLQLFVIVAIVSVAADIWRGQSLEEKHIPQLQGLNLSNELVDINQLSQQQPVLVYFWGSWCVVCNVVSPSVNTISNYYPVVSIAMNSGNNDDVRQYLSKNALNFEVINDPESQLSATLGVQVTPLVMIVDQGKLTSYTTGYVSLFGLWWRMVKAQW